MPRKKSEHYVNNKELLEALIVYREKVAIAKEKDLPKPRITNYLGSCFLKIYLNLIQRRLNSLQTSQRLLYTYYKGLSSMLSSSPRHLLKLK